MFSALLAASLVFSQADANLAFKTATGLVENHTPRDSGTTRSMLAANYLLDAASAAGADVRRDMFVAKTPKGERRFTNLVASFKRNPDAPWVVLVSHYDTKTGVDCPGANDGASTSGLLVALAGVLYNHRTQNDNVMLIWTDGEECMNAYVEDDGLWGSRHAAKSLKESGVTVKAVICLDMLGDKDLHVSIPKNSSPALSKIALAAAKKAGVADKVSRVDLLVKDDHVPFLEAGFKAIDLIDFEYGSAPGLNDYWHTDKDTVDKISEESLFTAGKLVVGMLDILLQ
ncbi:MAG: M28 family peptidase [Kiritimatiellae bacterium]|nr:M28 family peptidase [Kiritimatiellia bacterium]